MGIVITAFAALACLQGDGLLGARAVIGKLTATDPEITTTIRELEFLATLDRFARESPAMTPSTAGERWFALIAEGSKVPRRPPANGMPEPPGSLGTVFTVLPRPESWPRISELVEQMPNTRQKGVLQKLFVRLEGDDDKLLRLIAESDASKKSDEFYDPMSKPRLGALRRKGSVEEVLIAIEKSLAEEVNGQLEPVPDLVSIWGESKAAPIYLQLLKIVKGQLQIDGAPSRLLAKTLVLANLSSIKSPQWQFGSSPTDSEYIAKLVKHYGLEALTSAENQQTDALGIHLRALLLKGEVKQVASILKKLKNVPQLESEEYSSISPAMASRLYPSVLRLMTLVPDRDLWELYVRCATCSGHTKEVAARLSKLVRGKEKMTIPRWRLLNYLADIHGAQGDVKAILSDFALAKRLPKTDEFYDISTGKLLPLGVASGDPSLVSKGVAEQLKDPNAQRDAELFRTLMGLKRYAEAESLIVNSIKKDRQTKTPTYANEQGYRLAWLYYATNRPKDVLMVLRDFPIWNAEDLREVLTTSAYFGSGSESGEYPLLGVLAAWALAKTGNKPLATETLKRTLLETVAVDDAFRALNGLAGANEVAFYQGLIARDPFAPRPHIWMGDLLRRKGQLDKAEAAVRDGIALDPSDGEADGTQRFAAYQILGEVLQAKGRKAEAADCLQRVKAGRLLAAGNAFSAVGLLPQAAAKYEASIRTSPTDYVAEEQLAICLDRQGKGSLASVHHKRAYELMPSCFGPITQLYGNSGDLFRNKDLLSIGKPLWLAAANSPKLRTSALFLLGSIETDYQGDPRKAVDPLREAIARDPRHLNALREMSSLGNRFLLSPTDAEKIQLRILALNPTPREFHAVDLACVRDLRPVYRIIASALGQHRPTRTEPLLKMKKSPNPWSMPPSWRTHGTPDSAGAYLHGIDDVSEILGSLRFAWGQEQEGGP